MEDVRSFIDAAQAFFSALASVAWAPLGAAVVLQVVRLGFRARAWQNIVQAAAPDTEVPYGSMFGAYVAGVGVNSIVPARGGDAVKVYLAKQRLEYPSYPTLISTLVVETLFDFVVATGLFIYALTLGLLPGVPDLPNLSAFDWTFVVEHPRLATFLGCVALGGIILLIAWASRRVTQFKENVVKGFRILGDWRAYLAQVVSWQAGSWLVRAFGVYFFLRAFHIDAGVHAVVAVLVVQGLSTLLPFTPGGAGTQQAVLVFALKGAATRSALLAFSVGMQLVTVVVNVVLGFGAVAIMLRTLHVRRQLLAARREVATAGSPTPRSRSAERV